MLRRWASGRDPRDRSGGYEPVCDVCSQPGFPSSRAQISRESHDSEQAQPTYFFMSHFLSLDFYLSHHPHLWVGDFHDVAARQDGRIIVSILCWHKNKICSLARKCVSRCISERATDLFVIHDAVLFVVCLDARKLHHEVHEVGAALLTLQRHTGRQLEKGTEWKIQAKFRYKHKHHFNAQL